ncbi:hypothetical protein QQ045_003661 [Rhodiola kirilowii]
MALTSPQPSIKLLIFVFCACINFQSTYSQTPLIHYLCGKTHLPTLCTDYFSSHPDSKYANTINAVREIALHLTEKYASNTINKLTHIIYEYSESFDLADRLKTCKIQYEFILEKIVSTHHHWMDHMNWKEGGLGFKKFDLVNEALLAKQAGRLLKHPELLVSKVFKARYFPYTNIIHAKIGSRPSWAWRSIHGVLHTLRECITSNSVLEGQGEREIEGNEISVRRKYTLLC